MNVRKERNMNVSVLKWAGVCAMCVAELVTEKADPLNDAAANVNQNAKANANQNAANLNANASTSAQFGVWGQSPWFTNSGLRTELGLTEAQYNHLNNNYNQAYASYQQSMNGLGQDLSNAQIQAERNQLYSQFQNQFNRNVETVLTDPAARQRYNELNLQYQGYAAFNNPTLQQELKLTPEQIRQLNKYNDNFNSRWDRWNTQYSTNRDSVSQQLNDALAENQKNLNDVLTPEQRQTWRRLTGRRYDFIPDIYFGGSTTTRQQ
jgi:hypothetical protein